MLTSIRSFFSAPIFPDNEDKTRRARLLHVILTAETYVLLLTLSASLINNSQGVNRVSEVTVMTTGLLLILLWRFFMRRGQVSIASIGMIVFFVVSITMILASGGTIRSAGMIFFPLVVVMASLLVNRRAGVGFFILVSLIGIGLVQGELSGILPQPSNTTTFASNAIIIAGLGLTLVLLNLATQGTDDALKRAHEKELEVRELASNLELKVTERTRALATTAEVSRRLSTILDPNQLLAEVVEQIRNAFNYYHAHIYLKDESGNELIMAGGTGEVGKALLAKGHKIPTGKGLVGHAAQLNKTLLVKDTSQDPDWLPNPLLPETKSEIAVPISVGTEVLGVLDVQQNTVNGLQEEDANLLLSIAYQVAIALKNAQAYTNTQDQAERQSVINEIGKKIQNTSTIEQALQVTVRELGQALGVRDSRVVLSLPDELLDKVRE